MTRGCITLMADLVVVDLVVVDLVGRGMGSISLVGWGLMGIGHMGRVLLVGNAAAILVAAGIRDMWGTRLSRGGGARHLISGSIGFWRVI
jgi:hypothetical protein